MSGSIKVGGNTIATHTGAQGAGEVTLGTNIRLPASGGIQDSSGNNILTESGGATTVSNSTFKLNSSGNSITKSDGTTAVLSESGGIVTLKNSTVDTTVKVNDGHTTDTINKFVAKAWVNFQYQSSTLTTNSNFNLTITRSSAGAYYGTFTNAMSNNDYVVVVSSQVVATFPRTINVQQGAKSTTRTGTISFDESGSLVDPYDCSILVFGD